MNSLPAPLRQAARDLVDKKLWPIAVLLLAALVAVPLMIGGSSSGDAGAPPVPPGAVAPAGPDSESLITVVDQAVTGEERPGDVRDPIYDPPDPEEPASESTTGGAATGSAPSTPAAPAGGPADTSSVPAGPGTSTPVTPAAPSVGPENDGVHYRTVVRWYVADEDSPRKLSRLTPLGPIENPVALYLGVTRSKDNYAVFLLGTQSTSEGDGKCEDEQCRVVGLKAGDKRTVAYELESGQVRRYHLEVTMVKTVTTDAAEAREMRARVHPDGRDVMRAMWQNQSTAEALGPVQYDRDRGLLYKVRDAEKGAK